MGRDAEAQERDAEAQERDAVRRGKREQGLVAGRNTENTN